MPQPPLTHYRYAVPSLPDYEFNVYNYGAIANAPMDGSGTGFDNTAAFQACFTACQGMGGGRIRIPPGYYRMTGQVTYDQGSGHSSRETEIDATGAIIWLDPSSSNFPIFLITNVDRLMWRGGFVMGWNGANPLVLPTFTPSAFLELGSCQTIIDSLIVNGAQVSSGGAQTGFIWSIGGSLFVRHCAFNSLRGTSNNVGIYCDRPQRVELFDCHWFDSCKWNGNTANFGAGANPMVLIGNPSTDVNVAPVSGSGVVRVRDCSFDEGSGDVVIGNNNHTTLLANFVVPTAGPGSFVTINVGSTAFIRDLVHVGVADQLLIGGGVGQYFANNVIDATHVQVWWLAAATSNLAAGNTTNAIGASVDGAYLDVAEVSGCQFNVEPAGAGLSRATWFNHVKRAIFRDNFTREGTSDGMFVNARYCDVLEVTNAQTQFDTSALHKLDVDSTVGTVKVIDADVDTTGATPGQLIFEKNGLRSQKSGAVLSISSNSITPTAPVHHVGAGLIKNIVVPPSYLGGSIVLIPDAAFTTDATGNISIASTAVIGKALVMTWDGTKWNPSY